MRISFGCVFRGGGTLLAEADNSVVAASRNVLFNIDTDNIKLTDLDGNEADITVGPHGGNPDKRTLVDGDFSSSASVGPADASGNGIIGYITIDAGQEYTVNKVRVNIVHNWGAGDFSIELSSTEDFADPITVYNNTDGKEFTADSSVQPSSVLMNEFDVVAFAALGVTFEFSPVKARYIRVSNNIYGNGQLHNVTCMDEIAMYAVTDGAVVYADKISGTYKSATDVRLYCTDEDADIYYTTDGSVPTVDSLKYTPDAGLKTGMYIRAVSYKDGAYGAPFDFDYANNGAYNILLNKSVRVFANPGNGGEELEIGEGALADMDAAVITDGIIADSAITWVGTASPNVPEIRIDMGEDVWINRIFVYTHHVWNYYGLLIQLSEDENFENATTVYADSYTALYGYNVPAVSLDPAYVQYIDRGDDIYAFNNNATGTYFDFQPVRGRYLRYFCLDNYSGRCILSELQAFTCPDPNFELQKYVSSVESVDDTEVYVNKDFDDLELPDKLNVTYSDGTTDTVACTWQSDDYDKTTPSVYTAICKADTTRDYYGLTDIEISITVKELVTDAFTDTLASARSKQESDYSKSSWTPFASALAEAERINALSYKTQSEVNSALRALSDAMQALKGRGDGSALTELYNRVKDIESSIYTSSSFAAFGRALQAVADIADGGGLAESGQDEIDALYDALCSAYSALAVRATQDDLDELSDYIADCVSKYGNSDDDTQGYYIETYAAYLEALIRANRIVDFDGELPQSDVTACRESLAATVAALVKYADRTKLDAAIEQAQKINKDEYTPLSYSEFEGVYSEAKKYHDLDSPYLEQGTADEYAEKLAAAILALVKKADKTALEANIEKSEAIVGKDYTSESFIALDEALYNARKVYRDENATQEQADSAANALATAFDGLVRAAERTKLAELIAEAQKSANKTDELTQAINYAQAMVDFEGEITQEQLDEAEAILRTAMSNAESSSDGCGCGGSADSVAAIAAVALLFAVVFALIERRRKNA